MLLVNLGIVIIYPNLSFLTNSEKTFDSPKTTFTIQLFQVIFNVVAVKRIKDKLGRLTANGVSRGIATLICDVIFRSDT